MKRKLIKDLLSDIYEMLRPAIFTLALVFPIVFANWRFSDENKNNLTALCNVLKGIGVGVLVDIIWVFIWVKITDFISKIKKN